jgi:outer membrane protein TolC
MNCDLAHRICIIIGLVALLPAVENAADARRLTLTEAVHLALTQNRTLKIARLKVVENEHKKAGERSSYFPKITNQSNALHVTDLENIVIPAGALGAAAGTLIPAQSTGIGQGSQTIVSSGTQITQPLTQLIRIHAANRIAAAETAASRDEVKNAENQIAVQVHTLYFGILIAQLQKQAAEQQASFAGQNLRESEEDVRNGSALNVAAIQGQAGVLESQQSVLTAELQLSDLTAELNDLLGLPIDTLLQLDPSVPPSFEEHPRDEYVKVAWSGNPGILAAEETIRKASAGLTAAKSAYIPDITAYARDSYQNGVPFLVHNFGTFGVNLDWDVFDFGKRRAAVREREAQLSEAEENLKRLKEEVEVRIEKSYNKLERTRHMVQVADQVVKLRREGERLAQNRLIQGVALVSERREATAETYKAQAAYLQATLGYLLAGAELEREVGRTPGR